MSTFSVNGTTPQRTDTKRMLWVRLVAKYNSLYGGSARNNPQPTDTKRQLMAKADNARAGR